MQSEETMRIQTYWFASLTSGDLAGTKSWNLGNELLNTGFMCLLNVFQWVEETIEIVHNS